MGSSASRRKSEQQAVAPEHKQDNENNTKRASQGGSISSETSAERIVRAKPKHHKKWRRRFKFGCCCVGYKRNKESIRDVASLFAEYYADLKVSSSDLVAGMVMLSKFQLAQQEYMIRSGQKGIEAFLSGVPIKESTKFLDLGKAEDSHLVNDLIYYMNYSLATFGWPLQLMENPCDLCSIYPHMKWSACFGSRRKSSNASQSQSDIIDDDENDGQADKDELREQQRNRKAGVLEDNGFNPIIEGDNCCSCNWASVEHRLNAHHFEIIYISYQSDIGVTPFLVAADHAREIIVVSIRGSMNLSDALTDFLGQADKLPIEDCPNDWLSHRGMTRAALYVKNRLLNERILARAFNCRPDWDTQDYGLLLCGHSLGAGVAAILGVILRPHYPKLRAYLYSPPGGILTLPVVEYTKQFAVSIVLGYDVVARVGMAQFERLRYQLLLALKNTDKSTGKVLTKALCPGSCIDDNVIEYDQNCSIDFLNANSGSPIEFNGREIPFQKAPLMLFLPGRIIHIVRNRDIRLRRSSISAKSSKDSIYQAIWSTDNTLYDRILISEGMFSDHMPQQLMLAMRMLFTKTLPHRRDSIAPAQIQSTQHDEASTSDNENIRDFNNELDGKQLCPRPVR